MLLDGDGFDHYGGLIANNLLGIATYGPGATISTAQVRTGTHSLKIGNPGGFNNNGDLYYRRPIPAGARTVVGNSTGLWMVSLPPQSDKLGIFFLDTNANVIACFTFNTDGRVNAWRGDRAVFLGQSVLPVLTVGTWLWFEAKCGVSSTVGSMAMRIDHALVEWTGGTSSGGLLENVNTNGTGNLITQMRLGKISEAGTITTTVWDTYWDDWLIWDTLGDDNNDWIDDNQLFWRVPTADHPTINDFTPNAGVTNWDKIDEASPSAADYMRSLVGDTQYAAEFADLPTDISDVIGIIPYLFAKKLNPGACTVNLGMLTSGFLGNGQYQASGPDIQITTTDTFWRAVLERNPATSLPYTRLEVDSSYLHLDRIL